MSDKRPDLIIAPSERKTLQTIAGNECHWPYGDPQQPDSIFAGSAKHRLLRTAIFIRGAVAHPRRGRIGRTFPSAEVPAVAGNTPMPYSR